MVLSYAGVPLTVPTVEHAEQIQAWMDSWTDFEFNDRTWPDTYLEGMTFAQHNSPPAQPKLGTLYWPFTAMRWGIGHFVCSFDQLTLIRDSLPPFGSTSPPQPAPLVMSTGGAFDTITTNLYLLPPRPINQIVGNPNQFYLLTLVDDRYHWWYNDAGVIQIISGTTWLDLYASLATSLGVVITPDVPDANYFFPDPSFGSYYQDIPIILDAVAYNCGQRIVRNLDGSVFAANTNQSLLRLNNNILNINNQASKILGGSFQRTNDFAYAMPREVHNVTPVWKSNVPTVLSNLYHVEIVRLVEQAGFDQVVGFFSNKTFRDTFHGTEGSSFANEALLALQVARDYWAHIWNAFLDVTLNQPLNIVPDGFNDIEWTYTIDEVSTRIARPSWNWEFDQLLHGDGNGPFYGNSANEPWQVQPFFAQITGSVSGTKYPWKEVIPATGGTFVDKPINQRTGTTSVDPAYELNASTTVANSTYVIMWRGFQNAASTKQEWIFAVAGSGSGTITVKESDGDPICTGIDTVSVDSSTMTVVCTGGGVATIAVKTHTQSVVTDITSAVCNEDGTITVNFTIATVNVVG